MSIFTLFALILLAVVTLFALANPTDVTVRFLAWQLNTTLALAVIGAAIVGGFLVFVSNVLGQQHLRARIRELQTRVRELEARQPASAGTDPDQKP
jgi:uncharacterized integral membrane protein